MIPVVTVTFIALYFAKGEDIRAPYTAGGGNTAGLEIVESNKTIYVSTYYPGMNGIEGGCRTAAGSAGQPGSYFLRNRGTGEFINHCAIKDMGERAKLMSDDKYELVSVFNQEKTWYAKGGIAVNDNAKWPDGARWPIFDRINEVRTGSTYWLEIPGLDGLVPVIDHFGDATNANRNAQPRMKAVQRDMTYRVDFAVQATGRGDKSDNARIQAALDKMNCKGKAEGGPYNCEIKGVNIYKGNYFAHKGNGTVAEIIRVARGEIGDKEEGPDRGPLLQKYYRGAGGSNGQAWCAYFVTWVLDQAGIKVTRQGLVAALRSEMESKFEYFARGAKDPQPGDVFFEDGRSHTGIVIAVNGDKITVIEGNTGSGGVRENTNNISRFASFGRVIK